ncbi:hypothetical protein, partial [Bacillus sp. AFS031507]|uniref:hypothetical protein n=1 Tax=Bacillus sp. AFS031507 TaxID=2033496 RepID=UPI000BFD2001
LLREVNSRRIYGKCCGICLKWKSIGGKYGQKLMAFSIIFLWVCIVLDSWFISQSIKSEKNDEVSNQNRYEFIKMSDNYNMIFDKQTGDYWGNLNGKR